MTLDEAQTHRSAFRLRTATDGCCASSDIGCPPPGGVGYEVGDTPGAGSGTIFGARVRMLSERRICIDWAQSIEATPGFWADRRCSLKASAGAFQPRVFRGRLLSVVATASISSVVQRDRSVPLGKY
jgi:hypothetical protein